jgi:hypothetical protein
MAIVNQYFCTLPSSQYVFKTGKVAAFIGGTYRTDIETECAELDAEIKTGHPHIYVTDEKTVDTTKLDPMANLKEKIIADYLATQARAVDPANDMGTETAASQGVSGMQTSVKTVNIAAKSNSK